MFFFSMRAGRYVFKQVFALGFRVVKNSTEIRPCVIVASFNVLCVRALVCNEEAHFSRFVDLLLFVIFSMPRLASSFQTTPGNSAPPPPGHFPRPPAERDCVTFLQKAEGCMPVICILDQCGGGWGGLAAACEVFSHPALLIPLS